MEGINQRSASPGKEEKSILPTWLIYPWRILFPVLFAIILLFFGWYAFGVNDQGRDFFAGVAVDSLSIFYVLKSSFTLLLWCLTLWYVCRIVLQIKEIDCPDTPFTRGMIEWTPRVIGTLPCFIMIIALLLVAKAIGNAKWDNVLFNVTILVVLAATLMLFFVFRSRLATLMGIPLRPDTERFSPGSMSPSSFMAPRSTLVFIITVGAAILILFLLFFTPLSFGYARKLGPATVVLSGLIFFTIMLTLIVLFINVRKSPAFLFVAGYVLAASTCNNNNSIRTKAPIKTDDRMTVEENFREWISPRMQADTAMRSYPIFLVAAEGGGIRAATWTAMVLKQLEDLKPGFMDHVYAISGVSGGGVGASFYSAYRHDLLKGILHVPHNDPSTLLQAVSADFLSDLTAAFIFHDNVQRLLPVPVTTLSRNSKLEDSWAWHYKKILGTSTMDQPFLSLWQGPLRYRMPNLFINGLLAETGQKTITSNLRFKTEYNVFKDELDVLGVLGHDIALKTAASLCARFPVITSGALLKNRADSAFGHILDGGYKENSGLETIWQLCISLAPLVRKVEDSLRLQIPLYVLLIQNSTEGKNYDDKDAGATTLLPDLSTIIPGFLNAWSRRTTTFRNITGELFRDSVLQKHYCFYELQLNNENNSLPLGWYLSDTARNNIANQALKIPGYHPLLDH